MNRFLKPLNHSRRKSSFDAAYGEAIAPAPLFDSNGDNVCKDYKIIGEEAGHVVVKYDSSGFEIGRETPTSRAGGLYEADFEAIDIRSANEEERAFLFNNLRPPKNASKEQRRRFYELQKVAAGVSKDGDRRWPEGETPAGKHVPQ